MADNIIIHGNILRGSKSTFCSLSGVIGKSPLTVPSYEGNYEIIPDQSEQIMKTKGRLMHRDVKVQEIPYQEVSNKSGGTTVTIGGR